MRITLTVLLATTLATIYCNSTVLSLPPSLITTAASLRQHEQQKEQQPPRRPSRSAATDPNQQLLLLEEHNGAGRGDGMDVAVPPLWKKDARFLPDSRNVAANSPFDNIAHLHYYGNNNNNNNNKHNHNNNAMRALFDMAAAGIGGTRDASPKTIELLQPSKFGGGIGKEASHRKLPPLEYDLNALLPTTPNEAAQQIVAAMQPRASWPAAPAKEKQFLTPLQYWIRHCRPSEPNCPQRYYRALLDDNRSQTAAAIAPTTIADLAAKQMDEYNNAARSGFSDNTDAANGAIYDVDGVAAADGDDVVNVPAPVNAFDFNAGAGGGGGNINAAKATADIRGNNYGNEDNIANDDDVIMLINGEQDVMKFLSWAMEQLHPYQRFANYSKGGGGADFYHPGMFLWKKLNLSGRLEPPLLVEEPHYIIVRRERLEEDLHSGSKYNDDPFIPPRGRKHNMPDLDALLHRYEPFVPNRGRRDKIKDIFKYDDLFFPNRGKKQKPPKATKLTLQPWPDDNPSQAGGDSIGGGGGGIGDIIDSGHGQPVNAVVLDVADDDAVHGVDDNWTAPPNAVAMRRMLGNWGKHLRQQKRCMPQKQHHYSNNAANTGNGDISNRSNARGDGSGDISNTNIDTNKDNASDTYNDCVDMATYKYNEDDQSVKESMTADADMTPWQPASAAALQQQQWRTAFTNTRLRRVAGSFAGVARLPHKRLHSMSTAAQQRQQQHQRQHQQQQYQRLQHQQQQRQPTVRTATSLRWSRQQQRRASAARQHPNAVDFLWWQQLQQQQPQQQQNSILMPQNVAQHSPEMQLAKVLGSRTIIGVAAAGNDDADTDDIEYIYWDI